MTRPTVVSILTGTWRPKGGMTSSALLRSSQFVEYGVDSIIFTLDYRADQIAYVEEMRKSGSVGSGVEIRNFFEHFRTRSLENGLVSIDIMPQLYEQVQSAHLSRFFSVDGELVYSERKSSDGSKVRRFFNDLRQVTRVDEISALGTMHRRKLRNADREKFTQATYLNRHGGAYAISWLDQKEEESGFFVYADDSADISFFKSTRDAQISWLCDQIDKINGPIVVIVDDIETMDVVNSIVRSDIKKIAVLHGNHLAEPSVPSGGINKSYQSLLNSEVQWDRIVCSTQKQAEHLTNHLGRGVEVVNIPQAIDDHEIIPVGDRIQSGFAFFGRLVDLKRLPEIINSFSKVHALRPSARLDIFGAGPALDKLQNMIVDLKLEDSVSFKGRVSDVRSHMVRYTATLLCSEHEGFGLVVGESMISSVPVISTDCNYGPGEIINDDSGILVEHDDFQAVTEAMIWCLDNPVEVKRMGERARTRILNNFSRKLVSDSWMKLVEELL